MIVMLLPFQGDVIHCSITFPGWCPGLCAFWPFRPFLPHIYLSIHQFRKQAVTSLCEEADLLSYNSCSFKKAMGFTLKFFYDALSRTYYIEISKYTLANLKICWTSSFDSNFLNSIDQILQKVHLKIFLKRNTWNKTLISAYFKITYSKKTDTCPAGHQDSLFR